MVEIFLMKKDGLTPFLFKLNRVLVVIFLFKDKQMPQDIIMDIGKPEQGHY
jgi:hypothetical protein